MTTKTTQVTRPPKQALSLNEEGGRSAKAWWFDPMRFSRAALRWVRVFWPVVLTLWAGLALFLDVVDESIKATPHPELVYGIFAVAGVTVLILAYLQHVFVSEHGWIEALEKQSLQNREQVLLTHRGDPDLRSVYHMLAQTRALPLRERQVALENELMGAEAHLMARLATPNFLAGSLVGLGLVGTFIGLLATLQDLSGVFAAMGAGGGGDASAMFTGMIEKMQGPMRGMGTAFVASLYGLLGSLVMGLVVSGVKRTGERMLSDLHVLVNDDIYAASQLAAPHAIDLQQESGAVSAAMLVLGQSLVNTMQDQRSDFQVQREQLLALTQATQRAQSLTESTHKVQAEFQDLLQGLGQQVAALSQVLERGAQSQQQSVQRLSCAHEGLLKSMTELRSELRVAAGRQVLVLGRGASWLLGGALAAALMAVAVQWLVLGGFFKSEQTQARDVPAVSVPEASAQAVSSEASSPQGSELQPAASAPSTPALESPAAVMPLPTPAAVSEVQIAAPVAAFVAVIVKGDSWWRLANRHGFTVAQLLAVNPDLSIRSTLYIGQKIVLPPKATF